MLQLREAEERRLSRSCSKSPGVRSQEPPIHFPQPAINTELKTPELKIQDSELLAGNTSDPKTPELKSLESSSSESGQPPTQTMAPPEDKGVEVKNIDTAEPKTKVKTKEKEPKPKPRRKPQ